MAGFRESELLDRIRDRALGSLVPGVVIGPGDDCAAVTVGGRPLLLTVDQLVEGRHFVPGISLDLVARKAIARSVSDIAAMAGIPAYSLTAGVLPRSMTADAAGDLCDHLHRWGTEFGAPVVGGDIASGDGPLTLSVTVVGWMNEGERPVPRSGAVVGDGVYVTGTVGGSFEPGGGGKHLLFTPRVAAARGLRATLGDRLHAMIDVSDGVGRDAARLARASCARIEIDADALPLSRAGLTWRNGLADGEDYELLFAAAGAVPESVAGVPVTRIGGVLAGSGCWAHMNGEPMEISQLGWDHAPGPGGDG